MKNPPPNKPHWDAAKIVGVYCMVSLAWIYLSDSLVVLAVRDPDLIARISIYKGSVFVLITALLLFKLITGYARSLFASYQDLRTSEERFRSIMSLSPDVISIISEKGALVYNSPAAFAIHGYTDSEMAGRNTFELIHPEDQPGVSAAFDRLLKNPGESLSAQYRYLNKEGTYVWMEAVACNQLGNPLIDGIVSISRSIVDRKELEEKRLQAERNLSYSQKLESLGVLAGGIAHDFNNILTAVMGNISFAKKLIQTSRDPNEALERAEKASLRAAALARRLVVFAKGGNPVKSTVCLEKVLEETGALVLSGTNVKSTVDIPRPLHAVQADEGQIAQSFHNIIINAVQSMPGGGNLTISGTNVLLGEQNSLGLPAGKYVSVSFRDEGCGIPEANLKKIFDPYFTTKPGGSGLGLASVYTVIAKHGGHISVSSDLGKGSTFAIHLPSLGETVPGRSSHPEQAVLKRARGKILVMDDEKMVRELASGVLGLAGYTVTTCVDGKEAIALHESAKTAGTPFAVMIMDLTIPGGMGGVDAARRILSLDPEALLVVSSGYCDDPVMADFKSYGFRGALAKPYQEGDILRVIDNIISSQMAKAE